MLRLSYELDPNPDRNSTGRKVVYLLSPLVANDEEQLKWFSTHDFMYHTERAEDRRTPEFLAFQVIVALRGEWARLEARCREVIAHPPGSAMLKNTMVDHHFFLALARADEAGMLSALSAMLEPKALKSRNRTEGGYTLDLICTDAVMYTKLAWRRGCRIDSGSTLVPRAWLPLDPPPDWPRSIPV